MWRTFVHIFKQFDGNFCIIFKSVFIKTCEELWEKYAIIGITIDIDTTEKYP